MKRSRIEWCDHEWNPITGCLDECQRCAYDKILKTFGGVDYRFNLSRHEMYRQDGELRILDSEFISEVGHKCYYPFGILPTYHRYRLKRIDIKTGKNILCGSIGEMFGHAPWCYEEIFNVCKSHAHNNYLFLSGTGYRELWLKGILPMQNNLWYGSVIYKKEDTVFCAGGYQHFLYINPQEDLDMAKHRYNPKWIVIGTKGCMYGGKACLPQKSWVENIISYAAMKNIPVFMESTLEPLFPEGIRQDYPEQLMWSQGKRYSGKIRERMVSTCGKCKKEHMKHDMIAICGRIKRGQQPQQVGYLCRTCFGEICEDYNFKDILGGNENGQEKLQKNQ